MFKVNYSGRTHNKVRVRYGQFNILDKLNLNRKRTISEFNNVDKQIKALYESDPCFDTPKHRR